jgi:hypothetical protein
MTGASSIRLRQLEGMSIQQIMRYVESFGYETYALSNDEIYDIAVEIMDGHWDGDDTDLEAGAELWFDDASY